MIYYLCISIVDLPGQQGGSRILYQDNTFRIDPVPEINDSKNPNAKWGSYFWEFGDGNYKITSQPRVTYSSYAESKSQLVKVHMIPYYSTVAKPLTVQSSITSNKGDTRLNYNLKGRLVHIETSADGVAVPGQDIRVVIHYKAPAGQSVSDGYLVFFYNNTTIKNNQLNINFDPFLAKGEFSF